MFQRRSVAVGGRTISYARAGSGESLVLLHGVGGNARQFRQQLTGLADRFDVVAWDAPGYGGSDDPPASWTMGDWAVALAGFLDELGISRTHLLGQSWGGVLAVTFSGRYPERVRSLILSDTYAGGGSQPAAEREASLAARLQALATMTPAEIAAARAPRLLAPGYRADVLEEVASIFAEIHPQGYRTAAIALNAADERDVLPRIAVPTLVIAGAHDQIVPLSAAEYLRDHIPNARLVVLADAGHMGSQEQPELYNAALLEFLETVT